MIYYRLKVFLVLVILNILIRYSDCNISFIELLRQKRAPRDLPQYEQFLSKCPEIKQLCTEESNENLPKEVQIFECLERDPSKVAGLSINCQYAVTKFADYYFSINNLGDIFKQMKCVVNLENRTCFKDTDTYLRCLIEKNVKNNCDLPISTLQKVWIQIVYIQSGFVTDCESDIEKLSCTEGSILECLKAHIKSLNNNCNSRVTSLINDQLKSNKADQQLLEACRLEYETICRSTYSENELMICLMSMLKSKNKFSIKCAEEFNRQNPNGITLNNKNGRALARACKNDIKNYRCRKGVSDDKDIRWAQIVLCLEGAIRNRSAVEAQCQDEVVNHRKMLLRDYRLSPEIVDGCAKDIQLYCNGIETGGVTIHCLMEHARPKRKKRVTFRCLRALEDLVKESDAGEDWRVDPILRDACNSVVDLACKDIQSGNARVMTCLIDKIGSNFMTEACENAVMQVQYFVSRDFKLDPQLYQSCREDAVKYCHASPTWDDFGEKQAPDNAPLVLPCLYRYADHPNKTMQLSHQCLQEIRRVMHQRAISVDLQPEVEVNCMIDLSARCFDKTARGEEILCLQNNLDNLKPDCQKVVKEITERQAKNVIYNPIINKACARAMQDFCSETLANKDEGDVMECLIAHKNYPKMRSDIKCRAAIEHFQLIAIKDYHFTYKFKEACKPYVANYCPNAVTKSDVIECLSERVLNDTMSGTWNSIRKECRQQLRAQLFQQRENIDLDPKLENICAKDIKTFCPNIEHGAGRVLECLKSRTDNLSPPCHKALFKIKKKEMIDNGIDYTLMTACNTMIQLYCLKSEHATVLECLKSFRNEINFDENCNHVVIERMIEQNKDFRLNPMLQKACQHDINLYCNDVMVKSGSEKELNGKMIKCLKVKFREAKLKPKCENQMTIILRDQALNYNLNPLLRTVCAKEIESLCKPLTENEDTAGKVEECLKQALIRKQIYNGECKNEVASMIEESRADIHVDPLLQRACSIDLMKYCRDVDPGNGRHLKCLKLAMENSDTPLTDECKQKLLNRIQMFESADKILPPEGLQDLYHQVSSSPAKRYFEMIAITIIGFIFITGLFCGRITKRAIAMKNK